MNARFHSADGTKNAGEPGAGNSDGDRAGAARTLKTTLAK